MTSFRKRIELARAFEAIAWIAAGVCMTLTQFAGMAPAGWLGVLGVVLCGAGAWYAGTVRDGAVSDEAAVQENRAWQQHLREERERAPAVETCLPAEMAAAVNALVADATAAGHAIADTCERARAVMGNLAALEAHVAGVHGDNVALRGEVLKIEHIEAVLRGQPRRQGPAEDGAKPIPDFLHGPAAPDVRAEPRVDPLAELGKLIGRERAGEPEPSPA